MTRTRWIVSVVGLLLIVACSPTLEVGIEPTATPAPTLTPSSTPIPWSGESVTNPPPSPGTTATVEPSENENGADPAATQGATPTPFPLTSAEATITPGPSPTPIPLPSSRTLRYTSSAYPLALSYLPNWTISSEQANAVELARGSLTLRIAFRWNTEETDLSGGRSGMPAGDWLYQDKVSVFNQPAPVNVLQYDGKLKMATYGDGLIEAGDLEVLIVLEDVQSDYMALDIGEEELAEVKEMLSTLVVTGSQAALLEVETTLTSYVQSEYRFRLRYPAGWSVLSDETRRLQVGNEQFALTIGYKWLFESMDVWSRELPPGKPTERGTADFLGLDLTRQVLVLNGADQAVFYDSIPSRLTAGDLEWSLVLESLDGSPLDESVQAAADTVLASMETWNLEEVEITVVGWYGAVHSLPATANSDDYVEFLPAGAGAVGIAGSTPEIEEQIVALRDLEPPNQYAHFWGLLSCGVSDYAGCQLLVTRLRPDGPGALFDPEPVEGWTGALVSRPELAQIDDAFVLSGPYPVEYGIWSEDAELAGRIEALRDSGRIVKVWGQVFCGVPDANGCQIQVSDLEEVEPDS